MGLISIGAVAAGFNRDLDFDLHRIRSLIEHGHRDGISLLVLPHAALGGYLDTTGRSPDRPLPPAFSWVTRSSQPSEGGPAR